MRPHVRHSSSGSESGKWAQARLRLARSEPSIGLHSYHDQPYQLHVTTSQMEFGFEENK